MYLISRLLDDFNFLDVFPYLTNFYNVYASILNWILGVERQLSGYEHVLILQRTQVPSTHVGWFNYCLWPLQAPAFRCT